ncbi:MAG TPA: exosortase H [Candidatus Sulfopaludibacter sp.]|nr:exosortase H [Candidatus Sulfopaludibacter sp.]
MTSRAMAKGGSRNPGGSSQAGGPARVPPNLRRFLLVFAVCLAIGFGLLSVPVSQPVVGRSTAVLVKVCAFLVRISGGHAAAHQNLLRNPVTGFQIAVEDTCNASNVVILLCAAILAFPAGWRQKLKGIAIGTLLLHALNLVRIISLFYLGQYSASWFEFSHLYVWEGLMMVFTLVLFWVWVQELSSPA